MAGAAEAVAVSNDSIIAGRIGDSESLTSAALSASIDERVPDASTTVRGKVILATLAELLSGASDRVVTTDIAVDTFARRYTRIDVVQDHAADRTGATDASTAFDNAIAAANTLGGLVVIDVPPGDFNCEAGLTQTITNHNVIVRGQGRGVTRIKFKSGTLFKWTGGANGGGVEDIRFQCTSTPDTDSLLFEVVTGSRQTFRHLFVDNTHRVFRGGYGTSYGCTQVSFFDVNGYTRNQNGAIAFDFVSGAVVNMVNVVTHANCGFPADATSAHPAATTIGIRFGQGAWDTFNFFNVNLNRYDIDLDISVSTYNVGNGWVYQGIFDYAKSYGVRLAVAAGGGGIRTMVFAGCYAVASDGVAWLVDSSYGTIEFVTFDDCTGRLSGKNNWRFVGSGSVDVVARGCQGLGANRLSATNTGNDQDDLVLFSSGVSILGGTFGKDASGYTGYTNQGRYGILRAADIAVQVVGVAAGGATGGFYPTADTTADFRRLVTNNRRLTNARPEYAGPASVSTPTSGVLQTNVTGYIQTLRFYGGTVSQIQQNGAQVSDGSGITLTLRPGDTWAVMYSVAPTIRKETAA